MAAFDLTAADPLMKIHFNPRITKQFGSAAVLYNRYFDGKGVPISNRGLEIPVHLGPNSSIAWYQDGGKLPSGQGQRLTRASVGFKSFALAVLFTGAALDAAGKDAVTYAQALTFNIRNATMDAIKYLNIYSFLAGDGVLAKVGANVTLSTTTNTTIDVSGNADGARYLRVNMPLDVQQGNSATARQTNLTVVSIPAGPGRAATSITVGPSPAQTQLLADDTIVISGSYGSVITGLQGIVDDGTVLNPFQSVNRTTYPEYKSNVIALSGNPALARDHLRRAIALIQIARGEVNLGNLEIWTHPAQLHAYADLGWDIQRFNNGIKKFDAGFTTYEFEGIPWVIDTDAPKDHLFVLNRSSMFKTVARALSFDDRTGNILRQVPSSTAGNYDDKFVAFLMARMNEGSYSPNDNSKINGLAVPSGY
jgi:hypothetical protein